MKSKKEDKKTLTALRKQLPCFECCSTKTRDFERGFPSHEKRVCRMCKGVNRWVWVNPEPAARFQRHRRKQEQAA